jgi:hypothetical protein
MFKKSIMVDVGTWHAVLRFDESPKHGLRSGNPGETEKLLGDMVDRLLRLLRVI